MNFAVGDYANGSGSRVQGQEDSERERGGERGREKEKAALLGVDDDGDGASGADGGGGGGGGRAGSLACHYHVRGFHRPGCRPLFVARKLARKGSKTRPLDSLARAQEYTLSSSSLSSFSFLFFFVSGARSQS